MEKRLRAPIFRFLFSAPLIFWLFHPPPPLSPPLLERLGGGFGARAAAGAATLRAPAPPGSANPSEGGKFKGKNKKLKNPSWFGWCSGWFFFLLKTQKAQKERRFGSFEQSVRPPLSHPSRKASNEPPKKTDLGSLKTKINQNIKKIKFPIVRSLALRGASRRLSAFSEPGIGYGPRSAWGFPVSPPAAKKSPRRAERSLAGHRARGAGEGRGREGPSTASRGKETSLRADLYVSKYPEHL